MKHLRNLLGIALFAITLASCGSAKEADPMAILTSTNWQLQSINGTAVDATQFSKGRPNATFSSDNKIMGNGGCNSYTGSYNLNEEMGMNVSQVISTKMACDAMAAESAYFDALNKVNMVKIDPDKLTLMTDVTEVLVFVPKGE
ncbi:MAG: META domain-containing protein [Flavobacterium sp.]